MCTALGLASGGKKHVLLTDGCVNLWFGAEGNCSACVYQPVRNHLIIAVRLDVPGWVCHNTLSLKYSKIKERKMERFSFRLIQYMFLTSKYWSKHSEGVD